MGVENTDYISGLVTTWPLPTDRIREGDDHIRLLKRVLQKTFPNFNEAVTATPSQINQIPNNVAGQIAELKKHIVPMRTVVAFSGTAAQIPTGWALCNGQVVAGFGTTPDLRDKFVVGQGGNFATLGESGGSLTATAAVAGNHSHSVTGTALTVNQLPAHNHRLYALSAGGRTETNPFTDGNVGVAGEVAGTMSYQNTNSSQTMLVENTGGGQAHTHAMETGGDHSHTVTFLPPYYTLAYIIKVIEWVEPSNG